jgi:AraC-like DNA-binding protein
MTVASPLPFGQYIGPELALDAVAPERLLGNVRCQVLRGGWYAMEPEWFQPRRTLANYVAFLATSGRGEIEIAERTHPFTPGRLILAPPWVPQAIFQDPAEPLQFYTLHFQARLYGVLDMPAIFRLPQSVDLSTDIRVTVEDTLRTIVAELAAARPGSALAANGGCASFLALLWRAISTSAGASTVGNQHALEVARLEPVFRVIVERHAEALTLTDLASVVHLSAAHFSTVFRAITGCSPMRYLAQYRLQRVRELLRSTQWSVREIAEATGYTDPCYLSRTLRRYEGVSPIAYRRSKASPAFP